MTKLYDGDDDGDNDRNKYRNDDDNAADRSRSNGRTFDPITTPLSRLSLVKEYWATTATVMWPWRNMYLRVRIYLM